MEPDEVLRRYPKAVAHAWRQLQDGRLGLILGAGLSRAYGFPAWSELVSRVAATPEVNAPIDADDPHTLPLPILTEVLFQRYRESQRAAVQAVSTNIADHERLTLARWRKLVHRCLYAGTPETIEALKAIDSAYKHLLPAIKRSSLTVTYNFDDVIERLLLEDRSDNERQSTQTFQTIVDARFPFRHEQTVILHLNGYLPLNLLEGTNDTLVFSEGGFADQLIDVMAGQYSTLLHYLTKNTFLLAGLSLNDETLRHLLRQSARLSPGSYHYYVRYVPEGTNLGEDQIRAEVETNFAVYNLITLHLDNSGLKAFGDLLAMDRRSLVERAEENGVSLHYAYYLVGVPGVGKTTTFSFFNSLVTHDEWTEPRLPLMSKPFTELTPEEEATVDQWVLGQIAKKNNRMIEDARGIGIHLVDRCPPDAITFTPPDQWPAKARSILDAISPGKAHRKIVDGHLLLLEGDPREIVVRAALREKASTQEYTSARMADLQALYGGTGCTPLEVDRMSPSDVAREVARCIHFGEYVLAGLHERVEEVKSGARRSPAAIAADSS